MADQHQSPDQGQGQNQGQGQRQGQNPNPSQPQQDPDQGQRESNVPGERPSEVHDEGTTRRRDEYGKGGTSNRPIEDEQRDRQAPGAPEEDSDMGKDEDA